MDKDVRIKQLEDEVAALRRRLAELEAKIASLTRNSSNSSKPPSSDITKPPKSGGSGGRKRSFKKRKRKSRRIDPAPFPEERVDQTYDYFFNAPGGLVPLDEYRSFQQVELIDNPLRIIEHRCRVYLDPRTGNKVLATLPPEIRRGGLLAPKLTAWIGYLKSVSRCSYTQIGSMLEEVFDLPLSRGLLAKAVRKLGDATAPIYDQLCARLPNESVLNIDETGHKDRGKLMWTWCFPDGSYGLFRANPTGSRNGRIVLAQHRDISDPEHGGRYTVKRYRSEKAEAEDGSWRHVAIVLEPFNPDFEPITLQVDDEAEIAIVAELVEVLGAS